MALENLITEYIDIWTSAVKTKSTSGRGSSKKLELYGVKKLRELILELAVRGKLVPQNPNDEPASVLLERIAQEKAQLVKEKKIKKPKKLPEITKEEAPFKLPKGWSFSRLEDLCELITKGSSPKWQGVGYTENPEDVLFVTSENVGAFELLLENRKYVEKKFNEIEPRSILRKEDFLMNIVGASIGRTALYDIDDLANINQAVCLIRSFPQQVSTRFFLTFFNSLTCVSYMYDKQVENARPNLSMGNISKFVIPVPPIHEQHRIVAKVDKLMALCDQLEQQTENSIEAHQVLVTTLLDTLTNSADADELMQNWARISEHFDTLFTTEESIDQLKQTILQLAVMGKLVPQDPSDEPAAELLKRIAEEKAQLILKKEIPKTKKFEEISVQDNAFNAPSNWSWVRLETVFNVIVDCPHSTAKFQDEGLLCIDTNSFKQGQLHPNRFRFVSKETFDKRNARLVPKSRDIIFAREGSVGESVVIPEGVECCLGQRVMLFRPSESLNAEFLRLTISNKGALNQLLVLHKGIGAKHVNVGDMRAFVICLPPKMEQDRIVDKVNELLGLCELLKSSLKDFQSTQLYLTDAIVEQAV
ncbi:restriction endonuclease subunit S [Vibrio cholerae]|uniref:restriction endonuclease subunit S n=1 Tax=Vibrio cholerae TaxID=666 RepID=UPI0020CEB36D|nr:restriction endonuclease subunit S [Vibrio cholerae]MCQ0984174.1 restriction endonuclease subunit S [Vibrio cholerae]